MAAKAAPADPGPAAPDGAAGVSDGSSGSPLLSVVIPALHEEANINRCLKALLRQRREASCELIVVEGDPGGGSLRAIEERLAREVKTLKAPKGRARQMNAGACVARGRYLFFLHADTLPPPRALQRICRTLEDHGLAGGAFSLRLHTRHPFLRLAARATTLRSRITRIPFGDQGIFVRADYFRRIGGFADLPLMEDVELMRRIRRLGGRIAILPHAVVSSARRWKKEGTYRGTLRTFLVLTLYYLGAPPGFLKRFYPDS